MDEEENNNEHGPGAWDVTKVKPNEPVSKLPSNRTLSALQLTNEPAYLPKFVHNLINVNEVFEHYQPSFSVPLITATDLNDEDSFREEEEKFIPRKLDDFKPENIIKKSPIISNLEATEEAAQMIVDKLEKPGIVRKILGDAELKEALITLINHNISELVEAEKKTA